MNFTEMPDKDVITSNWKRMGTNFEKKGKHNFIHLCTKNEKIMHWIHKYDKYHKKELSNIETYNDALIFSVIICYGLMCFIVAPTITPILDIVLPRNETRVKSLGFDLDYGVDMQVYWFWLWLHTSMAGIVVIFNIIAADNMFITLTIHICYLFAIVMWVYTTVTKIDIGS